MGIKWIFCQVNGKKCHYKIISMFCIECEGSVPESMSVLSVFATVFTSEIFSNFNWNALKSPNISAHGGAAVGTSRVDTNHKKLEIVHMF